MKTTEPRLLRVEAVADLPVLWATLQRLDLPATLDRHFPTPAHWKGPLTPAAARPPCLPFRVSRAAPASTPATPGPPLPPPGPLKSPPPPGDVLTLWLLFVVSQGDHCLNHVQPWVARHQGTLSALLGKAVLPVHFHDDRLADWLTRLGDSAS